MAWDMISGFRETENTIEITVGSNNKLL